MTYLKPLALTGLILTAPAIAAAQYGVGDTIGKTDAEIRAAMEAEGYVVQDIEREDGEIEVEVLIDGVETEFVLAATDGTLLEIEVEDDDDDD